MTECDSSVMTNSDGGSSSRSDQSVEGTSTSTNSLSLRIQKKLAGKFANRKITNLFMSDGTERLFDRLHEVLKLHYGKKDAEKVVKNVIKLAVKLAIHARHSELTEREEAQSYEIETNLHNFAMIFVSFASVSYSYDRAFYQRSLQSLKNAIEPLISDTLSDKSIKRMHHVFDYCQNEEFSDTLFRANGPYAAHLQQIRKELENLLDSGEI